MYRPDLLQQHSIPGSQAMVSSYNRVMAEAGLDPQKEADEKSRKVLRDFMDKAKWGLTQGKGKYAKKFTPTAQGFNEYILADAAYNLHQGPGGKTHDEQTAKGVSKYLGSSFLP